MSIASEIQRLQTAKADIKTALESKGITVPSSLKIDGYADLIDSIIPESRVVAKFNVTDTSSPTKIIDKISGFSAIEIDGVVQPSVVSAYTFSTTGEHTVKYTLTDPTSISRTFSDCHNLTSIVIPNSVTSIGVVAFYGCNRLTSITIPDSVTSIGGQAFEGCDGLTSITIPSGVTSIDYYAFRTCNSLTSITIPDSVTSIGDYAFNMCFSLTSVAIGSGVTSIGQTAFRQCKSLTSVTVNATTPPTLVNNYVFDDTNNCPIYVPSGSVDTYKSTSGWSAYASRIQTIS